MARTRHASASFRAGWICGASTPPPWRIPGGGAAGGLGRAGRAAGAAAAGAHLTLEGAGGAAARPGHAAGAAPFAILVGDEGRGAFAAELRQQIVALGLGGDVAMPGHCDDLPAAFRLADLALHCSTDAEAFGRTIVEAQAMECPVIASDLGAPRETVLEGETGWRTPPGDAPALAAAITRALALPAAERARIGAQGRAMVLEHYTTAAMQRATLSVYRELL
ncbi:glycosyltransferase family 4 protein [Pseudoroseomonas wenyumeiae]